MMANKKHMSIIVLNWNRLEYTKATVERILEVTTVRHQLVFVDNNSLEESGVRQYLDSVKGNRHTIDIVRQYNPTNMGVGGGRNMGLLKATGDYLVNIDDDVLVSAGWDKKLVEACDKVSRLGLTGVNVEPTNYPVKIFDGVRMRPKVGNLGGALLCMPRRVHKMLGFYMADTIYGHEDSEMKIRLNMAGLRCAYVDDRAIHLDKDAEKAYRQEKNKAHTPGSKQLGAMARFRKRLREQHEKTGSLYVPFDPNNFNPIDNQDFTNELIKKG